MMTDITNKEFQHELDGFVNVEINDDICDKLRDLCQQHGKDASEICEAWIGFKTTKKMNISVETLEQMQREVLMKKSVRKMQPTSEPIHSEISSMDSTNVDIMQGYTPTGKTLNKRQHTPDNAQHKRVMKLGRSPAAPFSPSSFSPASTTPSKKYSSRTSSREVVFSFGPVGEVRWEGSGKKSCQIEDFDPTSALNSAFRFMFQKLTDKAHVLNERIEDLASTLKECNQLEDFAHIGLPAQDDTMVVGRICCDCNGKLNAQSVILEGCRGVSAGCHVPVDLSQLPQYALFPGQIVAMRGTNSSGRKFVAKELFQPTALPLPDHEPNMENGPLDIVTAVGPFMTSDSTSFEPLDDLLKYVTEHSPRVCILLGPFLDSKNSELETNLQEPYHKFFDGMISKLSKMAKLLETTKFVLVPSQRDVHHLPVYPQPPFSFSKPGLYFASDPSTLSIDGVIIGITSTDILFHLGAEEISMPPGGADRLSRLANHVITQRSYYPLYPPSEDVSIDYEHWEAHSKLPTTPHLLILPSDLRYFVKNLSGCCCVNPGRLTKGQVAGTFAHLVVRPGPKGVVLSERIAAKIVRI